MLLANSYLKWMCWLDEIVQCTNQTSSVQLLLILLLWHAFITKHVYCYLHKGRSTSCFILLAVCLPWTQKSHLVLSNYCFYYYYHHCYLDTLFSWSLQPPRPSRICPVMLIFLRECLKEHCFYVFHIDTVLT